MRHQVITTKTRLWAAMVTGLILGSQSALAQVVGTMDYESAEYVAVPVGGGVFLVALGLLLGLAAFWKISRSGLSGNRMVAVLLTFGAAAFSMSGGHFLHQANALAGMPLSDPDGGTVDVYAGYQQYINVSGSMLKIADINIDACPDVPAAQKAKSKDDQSVQAVALPECIAGSTILQDGEMCYTDYASCIQSPRVTERAGYYWVRADYVAQQADHAAVCAEFGLFATGRTVNVTWDATLLEALAADFGYTSAGDYGNAAQAMWCWDSDGYAPAGTCGTHNFGSQFDNYGTYTDDPGIRPVFTCVDNPD